MAEVWTPPPFNDITTDELVTALYLNKLGNSLRFLQEVAYVEFTANVEVTGTALVTIVSAGARTFEAVPHLIEFRCLNFTAGASGVFRIHLIDLGVADLGYLADSVANETVRAPHLVRRFTPSAASHNYTISGQNVASQTSTVRAGAGGAGVSMPGFIRITRVPT